MPEPWVERVVAPFVGAALVISQYVLLYWAMVTPHILMPQCGPKEYGGVRRPSKPASAWDYGACVTEELVWCRFHGMDAHPNCDTAGCRAEEVRLSLIHTYGSGAWWQTIQPVYGAPMPAARTAPRAAARSPVRAPTRLRPTVCPPTRAECDVAKYKRAACTADNCDALEAIAHSIVHEAQDGLCVPAGEKRSRLMKMCAETECARSETGLLVDCIHGPFYRARPLVAARYPPEPYRLRDGEGARRQQREEVRERRRLKIQS